VLGVHNDDINKLYLEPWYSKRHLFDHFCWECGWKLTTSTKGMVSFSKRADSAWGDKASQSVCSWSTFWNYWEKNYAYLQIWSPSTDTCSDCHKFYNRAKDAKEKEATINQNDVVNNCMLEIATNDCVVPNSDRLEYELTILNASKHIKDAIKMQNYANNKTHES